MLPVDQTGNERLKPYSFFFQRECLFSLSYTTGSQYGVQSLKTTVNIIFCTAIYYQLLVRNFGSSELSTHIIFPDRSRFLFTCRSAHSANDIPNDTMNGSIIGKIGVVYDFRILLSPYCLWRGVPYLDHKHSLFFSSSVSNVFCIFRT